jgi:hypothetical protein
MQCESSVQARNSQGNEIEGRTPCKRQATKKLTFKDFETKTFHTCGYCAGHFKKSSHLVNNKPIKQ